MPTDRLGVIPVSRDRLLQIADRLRDGRQLQKGEDGMEVAMFVLPLTKEEALDIIVEVLARRRASGVL